MQIIWDINESVNLDYDLMKEYSILMKNIPWHAKDSNFEDEINLHVHVYLFWLDSLVVSVLSSIL